MRWQGRRESDNVEDRRNDSGSPLGGGGGGFSFEDLFGGGGGAGVTVSPVCFLIITKDGSASILGINAQADSTVDRLVEMIPGAINRVSSFVEGFSGKKKAPADESAPMEGGEE